MNVDKILSKIRDQAKATRSSDFRRFFYRVPSMIGLVIIGSAILIAILAPYISPYDPIDMDLYNRMAAPNTEHLLGTDKYGRDVFSRILWGSRTSLMVGIISVSLSVLLGIPIGSFLGYIGGNIDLIGMRIVDAVMSFPSILLAIAISTALKPSLQNMMIAISIAGLPFWIRTIRGTVLSIKENEYVEAAKAIGESDLNIIFRYILPNCMSPIVILATIRLGGAILTSAGLSFLGMGAQPPTPDWGLDLNEGRLLIYNAPWLTIFPGIAIIVVVLSMNIVGDALRDILDPRLRHL